MKSFKSPRVFLALFTALACIYANANSIDLSAFAGQHADLITGLGLLLCTGEIQMITKAMDRVEEGIEGMKTQQRELADRVLMIEQRGTARNDVEMSGRAKTLGALVNEQFVKNKEAFQMHKSLALQIETKSIASPLVGVRSSLPTSGGGEAQNQTQLVPKLRMASAAGVAAMVYSRRSIAITGPGASAVAETAARTKSEPIYTSITQGVVTVAAFSELSETALRTSGELEAAVDLHLSRDIFKAADSMLIAGATGFTGGFLALATADVLVAASTNALVEESVAIAALNMRTAGFSPNIVVVNPTDWRAVTLRRESGGLYVHASPLLSPPMMIDGMKVCFSTSITPGTAMLLDSRFSDFMPIELMRIELAYTGSQFTTGEITVRAELQGIPVVRDAGAIVLVSRA